MADICRGKNWGTDDPLGIGGLLFDACRVAQLIISGNLDQTSLLKILLEFSLIGLDSFMKENLWSFLLNTVLLFVSWDSLLDCGPSKNAGTD